MREEGTGEEYGRSPYVLTDKNVGIAVLLSLLLVGAGHMYVEKVAIGVIWLIGTSLIALVSFAVAAMYFTPILLLPLFMYVCAAYDAYKLAKRYNESIRIKGRRPW